MTEGHGQQPSQHPSPGAPERREVLEGRVIPSSRQQQQHAFEAQAPHQPSAYDPRQQFAAGPGPQGEPWSAASDAHGGQAELDAGQAGAPGPYAPGPQGSMDWQDGQGVPGGQAGGPGQGGQPPLPHRDGPAATRPGPHQQSLQQPEAQPQLPQGGPAPASAAAQPPQGWPADPQQGAAPQQGGVPPQGVPPQQGFPQQQAPVPGPGPQGPRQGPGREGFGQQAPGGGLPRQNPPQTPSAPRSGRRADGPDSSAATPDWQALADQNTATGARRRKVMMLTGGIVAIAVIAGGVATAVVMSGKNDKSSPIAGPGSSGSSTSSASLPPAPSFSSVAPPPPANPLDYLSTAAKDTAPLTVDSLFPGKQFLMNGRVYAKTAATVTTSCATGARSTLSQTLAKNACRKLIRVTYTNGTTAVTLGVAVFDDSAHALKLQKVAQYLAPLNGGGVKDFCHAVACRMTSNAVGRYAYFAISGLKNGKTITATDQVALQSANDASNFAFQRIIQRGRDAAAADPSRN